MSNGIRNTEASGAGKAIALIAAAVIAGSLFWSCEGSATQTTNGQCLHGTLVNASGAPVAGALVKAWPSGAVVLGDPNSAPAAMAETDAEGRYSLKDLAAGEYNLFGDKGQGASTVLIPRVAYASVELDLGEDTLTPPGTIIGKVMAGGAPLAGVFCWLPGSSRVAMTDSLGQFVLDRVPEGTYLLRYTSMGYAPASDSSVVVASAEITALASKNLEIDEALQPPAPEGLTAVLDPATGRVALSWNESPVNDVESYEVQVRLVGSVHPHSAVFARLRFADVQQTTVVGTSTRDDYTRAEFGLHASWPTQDSGIALYRVRSVDLEGNRSHTFSAPVSVVFKRRPFQNLDVNLIETGGVYNAPLCRDTLTFAASVLNPVFDKAAIHFSVVGWFQGSKTSTGVYFQKIWKGEVKADTLAWYLGKPTELNALPVPTNVDSLWWVTEGHFTPAPDLGAPDSLKVLVQSYVYDTDDLQAYVKRALDVKVDAQGCYSVGESRLYKDSIR